MKTEDAIEKYCESKKEGFRASPAGKNAIAYESERHPRQASSAAEALDALLAAKAETSAIERQIVAARDNLPAVLARTLRLQELFAPRRLLEMSHKAKSLLSAESGHVASRYTASLKMPSSALSHLAETFESVRGNLLSGTPAGMVVARQVVKSYEFPVSLFFDEDTAVRCLEADDDAFGLCRRFPRELFAILMASGKLCRERKARLFGAVWPYKNSVQRICTRWRCKGQLFAKEAVFGDDVIGLSRPWKWNTDENRVDYPLAVNPVLQRAFSDSHFVRWGVVEAKLPGYEMVAASFNDFAQIGKRKIGNDEIDKIVQLADDSNPAYFKFMLDLSGLAVSSVKAAVALLGSGHVKSLAYIVREHFATMEGCLTPEQLLFRSATIHNWDEACMLAEAVEAVAPGTAAKAVDPFGNTPHWYALYNTNDEDEAGMRRYIGLLTKFGCDPRRTNHLGLTAEDVM